MNNILLLLAVAALCVSYSPPNYLFINDSSLTQCTPIITNKENFEKAKSGEFGIMSATMYHYCLKVKVLHQSGCGKYKFNLIWDGTFPIAHPAGANLKINLTQQESCVETKYETLLFDLSPIQYKRPQDTLIILALKGWSKPIRFKTNQ